MKIKVLHAFIIAAILFLAVRIIDISKESEHGAISKFFSSSTVAQDAGEVDKKEAEKKKKEDKKDKAEKKDSKKEDKKEGEKAGEKPVELEEVAPISVDDQKKFSETEIGILQRLSERREKLEKWEKDLEIKENVLKITEQRIDKKLDELRDLKKLIEKSLSEYNTKEDEKIKSLVKIYENMKPKSAADILAKMDMESLLPIMSKMKEKNAAEILAKMDSNIAEQITTKLSELGRLKKNK
jgi:flagellar motility protein MotE (MotC chaperone)